MLTIKLLNESFLEAIRGKWIKSISGVNFLKYTGISDMPYGVEFRKSYVYPGIRDQLRLKHGYYEFYEIYSDFEAYKKLWGSFDYSKLISHETVEDLSLIQELDIKQKTTEQWAITDPVKFIVNNLNILFDNIETIRGNLRYFYSIMPATGFYSRYGATFIPVGLLLEEWLKGNFMQKCSTCGDDSYSLYISPNRFKYPECAELALCPSCKNYEEIRTDRRDLWMNLRDTVHLKKNKVRIYRIDTVVQDLKDISNGIVVNRPNVSFAVKKRLNSAKGVYHKRIMTSDEKMLRGQV